MAKCDCDDGGLEVGEGLTPAGRRAVIVMRVLIVVGIVLTGFLTWVHVAALYGVTLTHFPLCGRLPGLDCESVLNSRWAMAGGIPVAAMGLGVYVLLFVATIRFPRCPWSRAVALFLTAILAGGAVWFLAIQALVLGHWCLWCSTTHGVGIALAAIVWPMAMRRSKPLVSVLLIVAGLLCVTAMAMGQWTSPPPPPPEVLPLGSAPSPAVKRAWLKGPGAQGRPDAQGQLVLLGGRAKLRLSEQIIIGSPNAKRFVVEAMDFRCHRCAAAWPVVEKAQRLMGDEVAVVVLPTPLCSDCNHYIVHTPRGFEASCKLAKLAWAVWLTDASKYPVFHRWLLTHQKSSVRDAKAKARALVGAGLDHALADPRIDRWIKRDVEVAAALNLEQLPAMVAGRLRINAIPDDAQALAMLWATGLSSTPTPTPTPAPGPGSFPPGSSTPGSSAPGPAPGLSP